MQNREGKIIGKTANETKQIEINLHLDQNEDIGGVTWKWLKEYPTVL